MRRAIAMTPVPPGRFAPGKTQVWACSLCGALVVEDTVKRHVDWHAQLIGATR